LENKNIAYKTTVFGFVDIKIWKNISLKRTKNHRHKNPEMLKISKRFSIIPCFFILLKIFWFNLLF
jgi:hypothetical protein